jgi:fructosamine-3-kinase
MSAHQAHNNQKGGEKGLAKDKNIKINDILSEYNLSRNVSIFGEPKKDKVWFVENHKTKQKFVLKRMKSKKTLFPIRLQHTLSEEGLHVPKVISTSNGKLYVKSEQDFFYLSQYIGKASKLTQLQRIETLANFHKFARTDSLKDLIDKVRYPLSSEEFLKNYSDKISDYQQWLSTTKSKKLQSMLTNLITIANDAYNRLKVLDLDRYLTDVSKRNSICHGDFNSKNTYLSEDGHYIFIDLDRAYYGPPIEDFRFLMMSLTRKQNTPPEPKLKRLLHYYFQINKADEKYKEIYGVDIMFPHEFHRHIYRQFEKQMITKIDDIVEELILIAEREVIKYQYLKENKDLFIKKENSTMQPIASIKTKRGAVFNKSFSIRNSDENKKLLGFNNFKCENQLELRTLLQKILQSSLG